MSSRVTCTERAAIFRASKRIFKGVNFDVRVTPVAQGVGKLFLVVPCKVGNAVHRNKVKRRARAVFYEKGLVSCNYHWILFAKPGAAGIAFAELQNIFETVYRLLLEKSSLSL
jgi:ribonuclease P protein component